MVLRNLRHLEIASGLDDLRIPPGNWLEALPSDRSSQHITASTSSASITGGELLDQGFLQPLGLSHFDLVMAIEAFVSRISYILEGRSAISADKDLRPCLFSA